MHIKLKLFNHLPRHLQKSSAVAGTKIANAHSKSHILESKIAKDNQGYPNTTSDNHREPAVRVLSASSFLCIAETLKYNHVYREQ